MAKIDEVHQEIGALRGTLETFMTELREDKRDKETRLRAVEKKQYWLSGVAAAAVFAVQHFGASFFGRPQI